MCVLQNGWKWFAYKIVLTFFPPRLSTHTHTHWGTHIHRGTLNSNRVAVDRSPVETNRMGANGIAWVRIVSYRARLQSIPFFGDAADAATVHKHKQVATFICIDNVFILNFKAFDARRHSAAPSLTSPTPSLPHSLEFAVAFWKLVFDLTMSM